MFFDFQKIWYSKNLTSLCVVPFIFISVYLSSQKYLKYLLQYVCKIQTKIGIKSSLNFLISTHNEGLLYRLKYFKLLFKFFFLKNII